MIRPPNMERDNKSETKRLAQRNATSYVFGSSTPRTIDLDLPALGSGLLLTPNRANPSDDNWRRRPVSAYYSDDINILLPDNTTETTCPFTSLNQRDSYKYRSGLNSEQAKACLTMSDPTVPDYNTINGTISSAADESLMSQSLVSLHGVFRGRRRHPELSPAIPRDRIFALSSDRINREANRNQGSDSLKSTPKRAVSMTRLDQLAQPRRRYIEDTQKSKNSLSGNNSNLTDCMPTKSMTYLNINHNNCNKHSNPKLSPSGGQSPVLRKGRFKSMTQLSLKTSPNNIDNKTINSVNKSHNSSYFCNQNKEKSKSMVHLSARPPPPPPRQTKSSKLRSQTMTLRNVRSSMSLNIDSLSPTRPISSMSSSTDGSEVKRRVKPAIPRKPRPLSIGSPYAVKQKVEDKDVTAARDSRTHDKEAHPTPPMRQNRARSAGRPRPLSLASPDSEPNAISPKPTPPRKPAHVKAAAMARKAIKQSSSDASLSEKTTGSSNNSKNYKTKTTEVVVPKIQSEETPVPSVEPNPTETPRSESPNPVLCDTVMPSNVANNSKKEVSEEDYKKMMAEKRRLAREQAEREAEADRLRIEKEEQEEEQRIKREEEELRRLEEEQLRLIELQKEAEEERLRKAVEENQMREEEENKRKAEEQRLRLEKEEKEKKAKEEAEKQRLELEERLRRDEEERLQRKKKLEAIMSRTRKTPANRGSSPTASPDETPELNLSDHSNSSTPEKVREVAKNHQNILKNEQKDDDLVIIKTMASDMNNSAANTHPKPDLVEDVNRAVLQNRKSESNGVSGLNGSHLNNNNNNHIENLRIEQRFEDNVLDINSVSSVSGRPSHEMNPSLDQLINLNYSTPTNMEDVFNSNHVTSNAFISTNGSNIKSQEQTITDLLS